MSQQPPKPYIIINTAMTAVGKIDTYERRGAKISSEGNWKHVDGYRQNVTLSWLAVELWSKKPAANREIAGVLKYSVRQRTS